MKRNKFYWIFQCISWAFTGYLSLKYNPNPPSTTSIQIIYYCLYIFFGFGVSHLYHLILESLKPEEITPKQFLLFPVFGAITIATLFTITDYIFLLFTPTAFASMKPFFYLTVFFDNSWLIMPWFLFYHLYRFTVLYEAGKKRAIAAETLLKISELENLKKQLNPHFLFNSLNSIKALTLFDSNLARESIIQLSELLRLSLNLGSQAKVLFKDELQLSEHYISLEKLRFDKRLNVTFDIENGIENTIILPMSLSTLIENAVKHGISQLKSGGLVEIKAYTSDNALIIQVCNTGVYDPKPISDEGGIGLENLRRRLAFHYGTQGSLEIGNENNRVVATLLMPY
jgi:two-component system LytT family sensor kinase